MTNDKERSTVFTIMIPCSEYPEINKEKIIKICNDHKSIKYYAFILHDKDILEDGKPKPLHYHIVIDTGNTPTQKPNIAKWFGVVLERVWISDKRNRLLNSLQYLTHEKVPSKYPYSDDNVVSNFDFREFINTKEKAKSENTPPPIRINFYIQGEGGQGKSTAAYALARILAKNLAKRVFDDNKELRDDEIYFVTGQDKVPFDGYNGQPILIWDDCRGSELLDKFNNKYGELYSFFDLHPSNKNWNIKFKTVNLNSVQVNIINSPQKYQDFLQDIIKTGEDSKQAYRRFPFIISLTDTGYFFLVNERFYLKNDSAFDNYIVCPRPDYSIGGNFKAIAEEYDGKYPKEQRKVEEQTLDIVKNYYTNYILLSGTHTPDRSKFEGFGLPNKKIDNYNEIDDNHNYNDYNDDYDDDRHDDEDDVDDNNSTPYFIIMDYCKQKRLERERKKSCVYENF